MKDKSFEFFMRHSCKIEVVHPYRTAMVPDFICEVRGEDMHDAVQQLFKENNQRLDNHIVFKILGCPLWFWYSDGDLRIGTVCKVYEKGY